MPENYIGLFEADSGFLRSELAITTWLRLAQETGCAQLFNCPVSHIHHDDNGVTIETSEGCYHASKALISAGTWVKTLLPELPVQPVRKVFAWFQADGRYSAKNRFPAFTGEMPNGDQYYGFPAENDELKIGKHNGGQLIQSQEERKPFAAVASDGAEAFLSCVTYCRVSAVVYMGRHVPMIIRRTRILLSIRCLVMRIHLSSLDSADMVLNSPRC
ncbi:sarcosine oxidase [Salmonella enterica subsp. salamae]|uniref:Sarcosine oxidase n=1 Tax=Salmonella enterica subsp. salamae TaxID=59202 RepID=A0A6D2G9G4_SALER|nr:sarcosine oxidase [Salmonella enterica subsp. salamae]